MVRAHGFDVNQAPSVSVGDVLGMEEDKESLVALALLSSPNDSGGFILLDLSIHGLCSPIDMVALGGSERSSSHMSNDDNSVSACKKLRLFREQSVFLEESFKQHSTLNPQKVALAKQLNL
ncbi:hypothetical protein GUJ93_ZPchr0006g41728 [Zizania palustris]|uniref:HD-ZIP protein N-terminal domain-containing protein n=1 Tax=Zizania palustris TaxID=103762 RepID=A0A8J5T2M8_ZIZPA|nr:hypothetical protein GUJ93_ZPchr0006g41728 [Zizania palustris]